MKSWQRRPGQEQAVHPLVGRITGEARDATRRRRLIILDSGHHPCPSSRMKTGKRPLIWHQESIGAFLGATSVMS